MTTLLVTGSSGQLGWELQHTLSHLGLVIAPDHAQMDLSRPEQVREVLRQTTPDIIVNAAAYTAVDRAEAETDLALRVNALSPGVMAEEAARSGALLIHYSTDYVFDGSKTAPYIEEDVAHPLNAYGRSKLEGERAVAAAGCAHLILRTSWVYSGRGANFVLTMLKLAHERDTLHVVKDQIGCPTWAPALALATARLLRDTTRLREQCGLYHLAAEGQVSRSDFAQEILALARLQGDTALKARIMPIESAAYPLPALRPLNSTLDITKIRSVLGIEMAHWRDSLAACLARYYATVGPAHE